MDKIKSRGLLTLLAFCGFLALAGASLEEPTSKTGGSATAVDPVVQLRPAGQAGLIANEGSYEKAFQEVGAAPNEIIRNQVEDRWDRMFCGAIRKINRFTNWTGRVSDINANGYFEVNLGSYITVYDLGITPSMALYKMISVLGNNQSIRVSGYFMHRGENCYSVFVSRKFEVHFTSIAPL